MVEYRQEVLKEKVDRMTITYNKLVRDRIPEIIHSSGKACSIEILSDEEYLKLVDAMLDEELVEYHKDQNIEGLADLLEVIHAAALAHGLSALGAEIAECSHFLHDTLSFEHRGMAPGTLYAFT